MSARVHPTAVIEPTARLDPSAIVGPFCYVGGAVELGPDTELVAHATVLGPAKLGARNRIYPYATLGAPPQDRSYAGEATDLVIGDDNEFRELVTVHRGTRKGPGRTTIGSRCLFMVGVHVAHDCVVEDGATLVNYTSLGGHVVVETLAVCGGHVAVAPFVRLGTVSFAAGGSMIERDVPPYVIVEGNRARVRTLNHVGLERAGVPGESREALRRAFRLLYHSGEPLRVAAETARAELAHDPYVARLLTAIERHWE